MLELCIHIPHLFHCADLLSDSLVIARMDGDGPAFDLNKCEKLLLSGCQTVTTLCTRYNLKTDERRLFPSLTVNVSVSGLLALMRNTCLQAQVMCDTSSIKNDGDLRRKEFTRLITRIWSEAALGLPDFFRILCVFLCMHVCQKESIYLGFSRATTCRVDSLCCLLRYCVSQADIIQLSIYVPAVRLLQQRSWLILRKQCASNRSFF